MSHYITYFLTFCIERFWSQVFSYLIQAFFSWTVCCTIIDWFPPKSLVRPQFQVCRSFPIETMPGCKFQTLLRCTTCNCPNKAGYHQEPLQQICIFLRCFGGESNSNLLASWQSSCSPRARVLHDIYLTFVWNRLAKCRWLLHHEKSMNDLYYFFVELPVNGSGPFFHKHLRIIMIIKI